MLQLPTPGQVAVMGYTGSNSEAGSCSVDPNENRNKHTHSHTHPGQRRIRLSNMVLQRRWILKLMMTSWTVSPPRRASKYKHGKLLTRCKVKHVFIGVQRQTAGTTNPITGLKNSRVLRSGESGFICFPQAMHQEEEKAAIRV